MKNLISIFLFSLIMLSCDSQKKEDQKPSSPSKTSTAVTEMVINDGVLFGSTTRSIEVIEEETISMELNSLVKLEKRDCKTIAGCPGTCAVYLVNKTNSKYIVRTQNKFQQAGTCITNDFNPPLHYMNPKTEKFIGYSNQKNKKKVGYCNCVSTKHKILSREKK